MNGGREGWMDRWMKVRTLWLCRCKRSFELENSSGELPPFTARIDRVAPRVWRESEREGGGESEREAAAVAALPLACKAAGLCLQWRCLLWFLSRVLNQSAFIYLFILFFLTFFALCFFAAFTHFHP